MSTGPKKIDPELRARAVRLVRDPQHEDSSPTEAMVAVAKQLGMTRESARRWVAQAEVDAGTRPGTTSAEHEEIQRLKAENRRLREDVPVAMIFEPCRPPHLPADCIDSKAGRKYPVAALCLPAPTSRAGECWRGGPGRA